MAEKEDVHYLDKLTSIDNLLARLIQLEEGRQALVIPNYTQELREIRKLLERDTMVYGRVINRSSGTYLMPPNNLPVNFETDEALGEPPTHYIEIEPRDENGKLQVKNFELQHVKYLFNCTNAVTYELYLLEDDINSAYDQKAAVVFDSGSGKVDNTMYIDTGANMLPLHVRLKSAGKLYYQIDWSAAPGNTAGYIVVMGKELK